MPALEPWIRKVHEHALDGARREDLGGVKLRLTEHGVNGCPERAGTPVHERHQIFADLEPDVEPRWIARRALEQELRLGAADLDLDRPTIERRPIATEPREVQLVRIDVLPDPHASRPVSVEREIAELPHVQR